MATRKRRTTRTTRTTETTKPAESGAVTVGAAWIRETKKGDEFISVTIDGDADLSMFATKNRNGDTIYGLSLFENTFKEKDNQPDYNLVGFTN